MLALTAWVLGGLICGAAELPSETPLTAADREHWAFRPLSDPEPPNVANREWPRSSIDLFILAGLEKRQLAPRPEADRQTLIRRLSFDLIGLPPTPAEIEEFLADASPDAYERLVDRLLASPRHGEHAAQAWLDLARFAETDGFEHDKTRPEAFKFRDWVIEALDRDMPYDEFVRRQLAADELYPQDPTAPIATAFCLSGPDMPDVNSQDERRHHLLNEMTASIGSVLLGLQLGCAQCHDHKYDPLSQADFYRLRAVFEPAVSVQKDRSVSVLKEGVYKPEAARVWLRGDHRRPGPEIEAAYPRIANPWNEPLAAGEPGAASSGRRAALARWITRPDHGLAMRVAANRLWQQHFGQGLSRTENDFGLMGEPPANAELLDWLAREMPRAGWRQKELRRRMVVSAAYRQASLPLAMGDASWQQALAADPDNELLSRFPRRRLTGEQIRDALLASAGALSVKRGGPGVMPPLPAELVQTLLKDQWKPSGNPEDQARRSIYIFARRNLRYPIFEAFDRPDANASCARRNFSTTAPQSLLLLNSEFSLVSARRLAGVTLREAGENRRDFVAGAFLRTLGRAPSPSELENSLAFLARQEQLLREEQRPPARLAGPLAGGDKLDPYSTAPLVDLCLALFNTSEFVYID